MNTLDGLLKQKKAGVTILVPLYCFLPWRGICHSGKGKRKSKENETIFLLHLPRKQGDSFSVSILFPGCQEPLFTIGGDTVQFCILPAL